MLDLDFKQLAEDGMPAEELANAFLQAYFSDAELEFPLNPFMMLRDTGVAFLLRPFEKYEGMYIPADDPNDLPVVGINLNSLISRQRYTAAHELCHHLKDAERSCSCVAGAKSKIEKYAESFAAGLLMPMPALCEQVNRYQINGFIEFEDVLRIAEYFGVSFQACLNRLAYDLHVIDGDTSPRALGFRRRLFGPSARRKELGVNDVLLYEQLFDAAADFLSIEPTPRMRQSFKTEFIFHDSRMEGVDIDPGTAAEIVVDLRLYGSESRYCNESNNDIIEVAGLTLAYDYVFDRAKAEDLSIYDAKRINEKLYATALYPEYGGRYRESNTLVVGAKFETVDYKQIPEKFMYLASEIDTLLSCEKDMSQSEYIEAVLKIHHRLTVVHAFRDGNGRTSRAFANLLFVRRGLPPVLFGVDEKDDYKASLAKADQTGDYAFLYEVYYKRMLASYSTLSSCL